LSSDGKHQLFLSDRTTFKPQDGAKFGANSMIWVPSGADQREVYFADVDGDGRTDIVSQPLNGEPVRVLISQGNTFLDAPGFSAEMTGVKSGTGVLVVADADADGRADLLRLSSDNKNILFRSDGEKFVKQVEINAPLWAPNNSIKIEFADFNGD